MSGDPSLVLPPLSWELIRVRPICSLISGGPLAVLEALRTGSMRRWERMRRLDASQERVCRRETAPRPHHLLSDFCVGFFLTSDVEIIALHVLAPRLHLDGDTFRVTRHLGSALTPGWGDYSGRYLFSEQPDRLSPEI